MRSHCASNRINKAVCSCTKVLRSAQTELMGKCVSGQRNATAWVLSGLARVLSFVTFHAIFLCRIAENYFLSPLT